jgi:hypothetical protein
MCRARDPVKHGNPAKLLVTDENDRSPYIKKTRRTASGCLLNPFLLSTTVNESEVSCLV